MFHSTYNFWKSWNCKGNFFKERNAFLGKHPHYSFKAFFFKSSCSGCLDDFDQELRLDAYEILRHKSTSDSWFLLMKLRNLFCHNRKAFQSDFFILLYPVPIERLFKNWRLEVKRTNNRIRIYQSWTHSLGAFINPEVPVFFMIYHHKDGPDNQWDAMI